VEEETNTLTKQQTFISHQIGLYQQSNQYDLMVIFLLLYNTV